MITLANFLPSDALDYWDMIGVQVDPDRITQVHVDGGGELSTAADSIETALDVEQAGGVAPGAEVVMYDAPNNDQGFRLARRRARFGTSVLQTCADSARVPGTQSEDERTNLRPVVTARTAAAMLAHGPRWRPARPRRSPQRP
jgi:kumamolisin